MSKEKKVVGYMSALEMDKEIPLIAIAGKKLDDRIQRAALSAINHRSLHNDDCYINRLYLAMPAGVRKSALTEWFLMFGAVVANEEASSKKVKPFLRDKEKNVDLAGAAKLPWFDCKKDPAPDEVFDAGKAYAIMMKKLEAALAAGKPIEGMSESQIKRLRMVMAGDIAEDLMESGL